jgi:hypothetical protein
VEVSVVARETESRAEQAARKPEAPARATDPWGDTPDIETLAAQQGVKPITNIADLYGDFWPEDESVDDFIATVRRWRDEGYGGEAK